MTRRALFALFSASLAFLRKPALAMRRRFAPDPRERIGFVDVAIDGKRTMVSLYRDADGALITDDPRIVASEERDGRIIGIRLETVSPARYYHIVASCLYLLPSDQKEFHWVDPQ